MIVVSLYYNSIHVCDPNIDYMYQIILAFLPAILYQISIPLIRTHNSVNTLITSVLPPLEVYVISGFDRTCIYSRLSVPALLPCVAISKCHTSNCRFLRALCMLLTSSFSSFVVFLIVYQDISLISATGFFLLKMFLRPYSKILIQDLLA